MVLYALLSGVSFLVLNTLTTSYVERYLVNKQIQQEQQIVDSLAIEMSSRLSNLDAEGLYQRTVEASRSINGRVMVLDMNGVVLADAFSQYNGVRMEHREVEDIRASNRFRSYAFHRLEARDNLPAIWTVDYCAVVVRGTERIGMVLLTMSIQEVVDRMNVIYRQNGFYSSFVMLFVMVLSYFVARMITNPIKAMTDVIEKMGRGDFHHRVAVRDHGSSELTRLGKTFNLMSEKIEQIDAVRAQFVSNASHELKTPLSAMKLLIESLIHDTSGNTELYREFLTDVNSEIDRLNHIINDLLMLVQLENSGQGVPDTIISLKEIVRLSLKNLEFLAKQKEIVLIANLEEDVMLRGNPVRLQQVVINLIDNAVKYTQPGGVVRVTLNMRDDTVVFSVADNGSGISPEEIDHIFERFYRVDKARSRTTGGTGLGLAIVKDVVAQHGGRIIVQSEENVGSLFQVELPSHIEEGEVRA